MIIENDYQLNAITNVSNVCAEILNKLKKYTCVGMSTKQIDNYAKHLFERNNAISAPIKDYSFPGYCCISVNEEMAHGVPSNDKIIYDGDLVNIDVSACIDGFYADNGTSFVVGNDINKFQILIDNSKKILYNSIDMIKSGGNMNEFMFNLRKLFDDYQYSFVSNFEVIHGVGSKLHEQPTIGFSDPIDFDNLYGYNSKFFKKNSVLAIEIFISKKPNYAIFDKNNWTLIGDNTQNYNYSIQQEHTILLTDTKPIILTQNNGI